MSDSAKNAFLVVLTAAVAVMISYTLHVTGAAPASSGVALAAPTTSPTPTASPATTVRLAPVPVGSRVLFLGDSWTAGAVADPGKGWVNLVAAARQWKPRIKGWSGSGFLNPNVTTHAGTYLAQFTKTPTVSPAPALIVLQGGLNDVDVPHEGERQAAAAMLTAIRSRYPTAQLVVLGPMYPRTDANGQRATFFVSDELAAAAAAAKVPYINAANEGWLTPESMPTLINTSALNHPNNAGHALIAERFLQDIGKLGA